MQLPLQYVQMLLNAIIGEKCFLTDMPSSLFFWKQNMKLESNLYNS